jgi:hypothetical protein
MNKRVLFIPIFTKNITNFRRIVSEAGTLQNLATNRVLI